MAYENKKQKGEYVHNAEERSLLTVIFATSSQERLLRDERHLG